ncbi:hypothetical protein POV27_13875 [Aureisphaera galaxeae]|uniref:hypothetical protein n=1 Tax=Aureisphaera galaxeae TaxID=1538023 RepID=UPI002350F9C2|nr:hypothetical protein [Aureisphaera galaxeae]MDC8005145.1 hypothetical protein [Aureisphaera galaxeae]
MHLGIKNTEIDMKLVIKIFVLACLSLSSCNFDNQSNLDESDLSYLKDLDLLEKGEELIWFDSQLTLKKGGNFLSDKRMAAYFLGGHEPDNFKEHALLNEIDSIKLHNKAMSITYASYIKVFKKGGETFKVYIDKDSLTVENYYNRALKALNGQ